MLANMLDALFSHLRSRKNRVAIATVIVSLLITQFPGLAPHADLLIIVFNVVAAVLIWGIAHEDAAALANSIGEAADDSATPETLPDAYETLEQMIRDIIKDELDAVLGAEETEPTPADETPILG